MDSFMAVIVCLASIYVLLQIPIIMIIDREKDCSKLCKWYRDSVREVVIVTVYGVVGGLIVAFLSNDPSLLLIALSVSVASMLRVKMTEKKMWEVCHA